MDLEKAAADLRLKVASRSILAKEHAHLVEILIKLEKRDEASICLDTFVHLPATSGEVCDALGFYARQLGLHPLSNAFYQKAVAHTPTEAGFWYNLATSERSLGRLSEAEAACQRALETGVGWDAAILLRSEVARVTSEKNNIQELRHRIRSNRPRERMFSAFALGRELHEVGEYDDAFAAFELGNAIRRQQLNYEITADQHKMQRVRESYGETLRAPLNALKTSRHIFIVGLPRSGTTLLERILGGLPNVHSNGETDNFSSALIRSAPASGGDIFERCARADPCATAAEYERLASWGTQANTVIEKLPMNYLYVGAIARALPDAAIIVVHRHPLDVCFAMYRTLFGAAYPFSYSMNELARYYAAYTALIDHWRKTLPGRLIEVHYEDLATSPEKARRVAGACGLTWSDEALDLRKNQSASLTASAAQVRGEIYTSSVNVWKRYRGNLGPLAKQLFDLGIKTGLEPSSTEH